MREGRPPPSSCFATVFLKSGRFFQRSEICCVSGGRTKKENAEMIDHDGERQERDGASAPDAAPLEALHDRAQRDGEEDRDQEELERRPQAHERPGRHDHGEELHEGRPRDAHVPGRPRGGLHPCGDTLTSVIR